MPRRTRPTEPEAPAASPPTATLTNLSSSELLDEFNTLTGGNKKKFASKAQAVAAVTEARAAAEAEVHARTRRQPKNVRARQADVAIRLLVEENPRRAGSDAHDMFEKMRGGITVREFLAKFPEKEQRRARAWLWNTIRDGYVKTF